jgi:hypothetical protein
VIGAMEPNWELASYRPGASSMSLGAIVLTIVILTLMGALPAWPYSPGWGLSPVRRLRFRYHYSADPSVHGPDLGRSM